MSFDELETRVEELEGECQHRADELVQRIEELDSKSNTYATTGYCMGMTLAMILSWSRNASILWCLLHGVFSWAYVIYFAVTR